MLLAVFATSSCDDKTKEEVADVIVLSRNSVAFAVEGGTTSVSIASPTAWNAVCAEDWIELTPEEGVLTISAAGNPGGDVRDARITVETAGDREEITVRQAFSRESVLLSTTVTEEVSFDSEGERYLFTVLTNGDWNAACDADWITVECDKVNNTVSLTAAPNAGEHRRTTVMLEAARGSASKTCEVAVAQISHAENPYYRLLGYYGLHAENWYYGGSPIGVSGTGAFCTIEQKEYRKSVYIKNLFVDGMVVEATYDRQTEAIAIELGKMCLRVELSPSVVRGYYLMTVNINTGKFAGGTLRGTLGEGYNDDADEVRKAILLDGFGSDYPALGMIGQQQQQYVSFADLYYATGSMYLVEWDEPAAGPAATAVTQAAAKMGPSGTAFPVTRN